MEVQATILIAGVVGLTLVFVVVLMIITVRAEKARRTALQEQAVRLSFQFNPEGTGDLVNWLPDFPVYSQGHGKKIRNCLEGKYRDCQVSFFDFSFVTGSGKNQHTHQQSIVAVRSEQAAFPKFSLSPESFFNAIGKIFGSKDINFEEDPEFSKRYFLRSDDEVEIRRLFTLRILTYFKDNPNLCVEGYQDKLLFYRKDRRVPSEEVGLFLAQGWEIFKLFYPHRF